MERVIIDMDEVIADPIADMLNWYRQEYKLDVDWQKMLCGSWVKGFPDEHQDLVLERLCSPGFFRNLPVMTDSINVVKEMNQQYEIFIVSGAIEFPNSLKDKFDWLYDHFPFLTWKQLVLCGDKKVICGDHMIDDMERNLQTFNGKKYLFTSPHNLEVTGYERLNNWQEVASVFLK